MNKLTICLMLCIPLLAGCWDQLSFRDLQVVTLIGIEGEKGDVTIHFSFPSHTDDQVEYLTAKAKGYSFADAKNEINVRTSEVIDISQLEVLLISEETAGDNLYDSLDNLYRTPRNRLTSNVALVQGDMEAFMTQNNTKGIGSNVPDFITHLLKTSDEYSLSVNHDLQEVCTLLFAEDKDLALPVLKIGEESGHPELAGTALFKGKSATGTMLTTSESKILAIMEQNTGKFLRGTYEVEVEGEEFFMTIEYVNGNKNWDIKGDQVNMSYDIEVEIEEFPHGAVLEKDRIQEIEKQLSEHITADMENLLEILQETGSDAIGLGYEVRAFHQDLWKKGDWNETFSELDIKADANITIKRTGIMN
ncbi:germination protein, Ger(x)C family [Bhargavaea cecembensis DSE10]|uniref:Germination protein, Ger(X)C family n=1 Tax=Bhargavaea cecembensis DSE10 TaxID=1235279 RepID=M7P8D9_9BACL|nr:Ger(x)C family spore germination protein [Bhargavaea cecembensis]EMR06759.1 germination protein, Ger(x)C family [Bhargavaea cecembensis DSE10]